jgi:hypothetical protein
VRDRPAHLVSYFLLSTVGIREAESLPLLKTNKQAKKKKTLAGHQQLTPVILATQEAEIRRIVV